MSTPNSLRTAARGEQAVKRHLAGQQRDRSCERGPGESGGGGGGDKGRKGPAWTFGRLEYLSR